jgi:hypothetical protein
MRDRCEQLLRAVVAKNREGKKLTSPILKFYSNHESPIQSEYAGKFTVQSGDWNFRAKNVSKLGLSQKNTDHLFLFRLWRFEKKLNLPDRI